MKIYSISIVCIGALLFLYGTAHATVWYVHPDSAMNCIQDCLDSCSTGDTALVGPGTYYENIIWPATQGIDLMSEYGSDTTLIDGNSADVVISITTGVDTTTIIDGFTIQNGFAYEAGGIYCNGSSPTITGNTITDNTSTWGGGGIECYNNSSPIIAGNTITNNTTPYGGGIECVGNSSPIITGNTITGNTVTLDGGGGIVCFTNSSPTITGNTITDNTAAYGGGGIACQESSPLISSNTITGNAADSLGGGILCFTNSSPTITDNTIENNEATWGAGIWLEGYGVITGNTITANVADSMGGGIASYTNSSPLIDSNYISGNTAFKGGGIWVHELSHPTISNNTISANTAYSGAGIRCSNYSHPNILNNIIENNHADSVGGGITCVYGSSPMIDGNTIRWNTANHPAGAGIFCMENSSPNIIGNIIEYNIVISGWGGGIFCLTTCSPTIIDNTIKSNSAARGGGIFLWENSSPTTLKRNIITYNVSPGYGAGIDCRDNSSPYIDSCTIAYNEGHGIQCELGSYPTINWVNIYDNSGYEVSNLSGITIDAEYCWWGDPGGPPGGSINGPVDYDPWLTDSVEWQTGIEESEITKPLTLNLQVSPIPFTHRTQIRYQICDMGYEINNTTLRIYDATGRLVKSFRITPYALRNTLSWDGRDDQNRMLPSGVYFVKFQAGDYTETQKLLLIR